MERVLPGARSHLTRDLRRSRTTCGGTPVNAAICLKGPEKRQQQQVQEVNATICVWETERVPKLRSGSDRTKDASKRAQGCGERVALMFALK